MCAGRQLGTELAAAALPFVFMVVWALGALRTSDASAPSFVASRPDLLMICVGPSGYAMLAKDLIWKYLSELRRKSMGQVRYTC